MSERSDSVAPTSPAHSSAVGLLRDLSVKVAPRGNVDELFDELVGAAVAITHADAGSMQMLDDQSGELVMVASQNLPAGFDRIFARVDALSGTSCGRALADGRRTFIDFRAPGTFEDVHGSVRQHREAGLASAQSTPLFARSGRPLGMLSTHWRTDYRPTDGELHLLDVLARQAADLLEARQSEAVLRESEERFRRLFASAPVAAFVCDAQGVIQDYNQRAAELWGREPVRGDPAEVNCGSPILRLPTGEVLPHAKSPIVDVLRTGDPCEDVEVIIERTDGSQVTVLVNFAALQGPDGKVTGAITSFVDISAYKRTQEELRRSNRMKDELLGMVSHEFRTPLTTITGNIDILSRRFDELTPQVREESFEELRRDAGRLKRLVQNMLVVARGESAGDGDPEPLLLQRVLPDFVNQQLRRDDSRPILLDLPANLPPVLANYGSLEQILENLVTNSLKYGKPATPIEIAARQEADHVAICVADSGRELNEGEVRLFLDAFYRAESARSQGGVGLGLAVCVVLARVFGGTLQARPRHGGGLEVTLTVPVADA